MRRWILAAVVLALVGSVPIGLPLAQAGQLPDDVNPESRSRLPPIDREELDPARRAAYDAAVASPDGAPTGAAALRLHGSGASLRFEAPMGRQLTELTILTTAREYDQPYEWALHELEAIAVSLDEEIIDIVRHRKPITGMSDREAIIIEVGRELFGTRALGAGTYARALALHGKTNLVDIIDVMGRYASTRGHADRVQPADAGRLAPVAAAALHASRRHPSGFAQPPAAAQRGQPHLGGRALRPHAVALGNRSGGPSRLRGGPGDAGGAGRDAGRCRSPSW